MIKSVNLKYQRFTQSGCKDLGTRNLCLWQKFNSVETLNPGLNEKMFYFTHYKQISFVSILIQLIPFYRVYIPMNLF